ncbi:MAG: flagellar protein FlaG [Gammaproteobacteria bacterium]|nr:flagellar protein FlaG [Gammaproteobacteria bacterium]NIY32494.1 flagellar biosynthesis protein FlaG [Gammaproteobacteria bacterium]
MATNITDQLSPLAVRTASTVTQTQPPKAAAVTERQAPAASGEPLPQKVEPLEPEALDQAVSDINEHIQNLRRDLHFSVDEDSGRTIIRVIDSETQEIIRQIPPEEVLNLARRLNDADGLILRTRV